MSLPIDTIVKEFRKMSASGQTVAMIRTEWSALWQALREHYKGDVERMDAFLADWHREARGLRETNRAAFAVAYPELDAQIKRLTRWP